MIKIIFKSPENWTHSTFGDKAQVSEFDECVRRNASVLVGMYLSKSLRTPNSIRIALACSVSGLFSKRRTRTIRRRSRRSWVLCAESGVYSQFAQRYSQSSDITDNMWGSLVTPDEQEVFVLTPAERDDFAQIDLLTMQRKYMVQYAPPSNLIRRCGMTTARDATADA